MVLLALELENRIDHMLQHPRPCKIPFLSHMADEDDGDVVFLGDAEEGVGAFPHLGDAAGGGADRREHHRLNRVNDDDLRALLSDGGDDRVEVAAGEDKEVFRVHPEPSRPQVQLSGRFLARDIEHLEVFRQRLGNLQQQRRLADARVAAQQHQRAFHQSAAQHPVQLG